MQLESVDVDVSHARSLARHAGLSQGGWMVERKRRQDRLQYRRAARSTRQATTKDTMDTKEIQRSFTVACFVSFVSFVVIPRPHEHLQIAQG
jgi:hypothetical protein